MSLLPYVFREMVRPLRMMDNHLRMTEELFRQSFAAPTMIKFKNRPFIEYSEDAESVVQDKEKFQVKLNVNNFKPEEIVVKTLEENTIQIEAKHEEVQDNQGFISRQLVRRFVLPKGHELKDVVSSLSSDGILTVTAPRNTPALEPERVIPITHTGPAKPAVEEKIKEDS